MPDADTHAAAHVDKFPPADPSELQKPLDHFRANKKRLEIHPVEKLLLWVVAAHLIFLPWAIGAMRQWSQWTSLGFAVVCFAIALIPRHYTEEHSGSNSFKLVMWPRLVRFPLFWLGLVLLLYITVQALNPSWKFKTDGKVWNMVAIPHNSWLPEGVDVPFARWGPWRMLLIYVSVWLTACSVWVGFTRRRTLQTLFIVLACNGLAVALFGIAQRLLGNGKMFGFWVSPNPSFFASFVYKNHAGAYLLLMLALTCGLAAWYYLRGLRRMEKSNPSGLFTFFATCIAVAILTSYARGVTLAMLVFLVICVLIFIIHQLRRKDGTSKPIVAVVLILVFGFFLKTGLQAVNSGEAWNKLKVGLTRQDSGLGSRELATTASGEMLKDYWPKGVGAGGFQFLFPIYQYRHPGLYNPPQFWEYAHNDILQLPIELGVFGTLVILGGIGYLVTQLARSYFWENPLSGCVILGCGLLLAYAWMDFPLQNPAILTTTCVLVVAITSWTRLEEMNIRS